MDKQGLMDKLEVQDRRIVRKILGLQLEYYNYYKQLWKNHKAGSGINILQTRTADESSHTDQPASHIPEE